MTRREAPRRAIDIQRLVVGPTGESNGEMKTKVLVATAQRRGDDDEVAKKKNASTRTISVSYCRSASDDVVYTFYF